jgi:hypothetical protein
LLVFFSRNTVTTSYKKATAGITIAKNNVWYIYGPTAHLERMEVQAFSSNQNTEPNDVTAKKHQHSKQTGADTTPKYIQNSRFFKNGSGKI